MFFIYHSCQGKERVHTTFETYSVDLYRLSVYSMILTVWLLVAFNGLQKRNLNLSLSYPLKEHYFEPILFPESPAPSCCV